jgi:ribose transport system substrate-binding protein
VQHNSRHKVRGRVLPRSRRVAALLTATGLSIALAACGSSSPSSSSSSAGSSVSATNVSATVGGVAAATAALKPYQAAPTRINITTPLKSAPPPGKTVVVLGTPQPQNVQIQQTVARLAHLAHWNYALVSYDPANPATFNSAISSALAKHANYIVEAGIPVAPAILQQVEHAGAKLAVTAVYPIAVKPPVIVNTSADNRTQGNLMADYFVSASNGKGNAVIAHVPGYAILDTFTNAFTARVKALCPGCTTTMANVTLPQLAAGQLVPTVISALKRNPSANYVAFDDGPFATGITSALAAAGLSKIKVIGEAADPAGLAAVRTGTEAAWTGYSSPYATLQVVDAMFRDAEGLPIPQAQEGVQPTQLLTKANVGSITEWNSPIDALQQFKALWKVSSQ